MAMKTTAKMKTAKKADYSAPPQEGAMVDVSDARLAVIANVRFGEPTTRDEEIAMATELIRRRGT